MKRAALDSNPELALLASGLQQDTRRIRPRRRRLLLDPLVEAAQRDDRAEFDRLFDQCFERVYAISWRITRDHGRAEAITAHILRDKAIEAVRERR